MQRREIKAKLVQGSRKWYDIKTITDKTSAITGAEVYIYDEIGYFGITAQDFVKEIQSLAVQEIILHLNTPGGEVFDGIAIFNTLRDHQAKVTVVVDSLAASIGSVIAMAGDVVIMAKNSTMMIHEGQGLCIGNAADMSAMAELLNKTSDNIASIYADRAGGTVADWRALMMAETWYTAEEAVKAGLADQVGMDPAEANVEVTNLFNYTPSVGVSDETDSFDISAAFKEALKEATNQ